MHRYPNVLVDRAYRRGKETNKVESLGLDKTTKIWNKNPASRRTEQPAGFFFCWRCLAQAYFRHRIFIRFTYRPCRNYSYSWRLSLASSPPPSAAKISLSCLFPTFLLSFLSLKRKSVHIFTSSLISSLIASYGLRVSVLINLPSLLVLVHFYLLPVSVFCIRGVQETASVRRINRKRSYIYRLNGESCQEFYEILLFRNIDWKFFAN